MNKFIFSTLLLALGILFQATGARAQSEAQSLLTEDLRTAVSTFGGTTRLFTYFNLPMSEYFNSSENRANWAKFFVESGSYSFWNMNNHSTEKQNAGAGVYFALDPSSSQEFGNTAIMIRVKAGSKKLNVSAPIKLRKATIEALLSEKIITLDQTVPRSSTLGLNAGFTGTTLKNMVLRGNERFRSLVQSIFKEEQIEMVQYLYKSYLAGFCKAADQSAFVLVGSGNIQTITYADGTVGQLNQVNILESDKTYFSKTYEFRDTTTEEQAMMNVIGKQKKILDDIRQLGTKAAANLIPALSKEEYTQAVAESFMCQKRINY